MSATIPSSDQDIAVQNLDSFDQPTPPNVDSEVTSVTLQPTTTRPRAWYRRLGTGIIADIRARAPWYLSDWTDAWNYRVVPATALIFFAK